MEAKTVLRRYYEEAWNGRDLGVLQALLAPEFVNHSPFFPGQPTGPEGVPVVMQAMWSAFPDIRFIIEDQVADGGLVATRTAVRGTHQGDFNGAPPTGRSFEVAMMSMERVAGGRIVEHWRVSDDLAMLRQLGLA